MNKALFLDRDGIINKDYTYPHLPEQITFCDGIFELCSKALEKHYLLIVITNQAGVAKGLFSEETVILLHEWMKKEFSDRGIEISAFYYCPYHKHGTVGRYRVDSEDRKPGPGMILKAEKDFNIDLSKSLMVGDKESDRIQHPTLRSVIVRSDYCPDNYDIPDIKDVISLL